MSEGDSLGRAAEAALKSALPKVMCVRADTKINPTNFGVELDFLRPYSTHLSFKNTISTDIGVNKVFTDELSHRR